VATTRPGLAAGAGWLGRSWVSIAFALGFFLIWEGIVQGFSVPRYIIPAPSAIFYQFFRNLPRIWEYTLVTGGETLAGFGLAIVLGIPLALTVAFSSVLRKTFYPAAVTLEMVPKIAFAPLFVTWLGFGYLPKVIIVFLVCFFPILLNGILAFTSLPEDLGRFCRSTGAGVLRTFWNVRLPAALPQLFVGIKGRRSTPRSARRSPSGSAAMRGWATTSRSRPAICAWTSRSRSSSCWPRSALRCSAPWSWSRSC
jgi:NitT/TauT family transport system permease protein